MSLMPWNLIKYPDYHLEMVAQFSCSKNRLSVPLFSCTCCTEPGLFWRLLFNSCVCRAMFGSLRVGPLQDPNICFLNQFILCGLHSSGFMTPNRILFYWNSWHTPNLMQICLSFYEVKNKQATWFTNKVERLYWEHWYINLNTVQHPKAHFGKSHHSKVVVDPGGTISFLGNLLWLFLLSAWVKD